MTSTSTAMIDPEADRLRRRIEDRAGHPISDLRPYARGQNANLYLIDLTDDRRMIAKLSRVESPGQPRPSLEHEGWMLDYLARKSTLPVPKVHWYDTHIILMDFIENSGMITREVQYDAATHLAALHETQSDFFGLERDTDIGLLPQKNAYDLNWVNFYRDQRLLPMARLALDAKGIEADILPRIETLAAKLSSYIPSRPQVSLIHGDLWGGNVLIGKGRISAFIDPAIYYADSEMDLAFIRLFHTFGDDFFDQYSALRSISPEFETSTRYIYSLYPLLIQASTAGGKAQDDIVKILGRFV